MMPILYISFSSHSNFIATDEADTRMMAKSADREKRASSSRASNLSTNQLEDIMKDTDINLKSIESTVFTAYKELFPSDESTPMIENIRLLNEQQLLKKEILRLKEQNKSDTEPLSRQIEELKEYKQEAIDLKHRVKELEYDLTTAKQDCAMEKWKLNKLEDLLHEQANCLDRYESNRNDGKIPMGTLAKLERKIEYLRQNMHQMEAVGNTICPPCTSRLKDRCDNHCDLDQRRQRHSHPQTSRFNVCNHHSASSPPHRPRSLADIEMIWRKKCAKRIWKQFRQESDRCQSSAQPNEEEMSCRENIPPSQTWTVERTAQRNKGLHSDAKRWQILDECLMECQQLKRDSQQCGRNCSSSPQLESYDIRLCRDACH